MRKQLALLAAAAVLGALGSHALEHWLLPAPAHAGDMSFGEAVRQDDGSLIITSRNTTLMMAPDGTVRVTSPEHLIIGAAGDVKIEGYRVKIDASSEVEIETSSMELDLYEYKLDASRVQIGTSSTDIKLADGSDPICINDDGEITKSQRVKAR